jgi:hypothetical protein
LTVLPHASVIMPHALPQDVLTQSQLENEHRPEAQVVPHAPQFKGSFVLLISQPFAVD